MKILQSFPKRLSLNVLVFTSILFIAAFLAAGLFSHKLIAEEAGKSSANMLDAVSRKVEIKLTEAESAVRNLAWIVQGDIDREEDLYAITAKIIECNPGIVGCAIAFRENYHPGERFFCPYSYLDSEGNIQTTQLGNQEYDYFYQDWYLISSLQGKPFWCEPYFDAGGSNLLISTYSFPIFDKEGKVLAILTADLSIEWLSDLVSGIKPYQNSFMYLITGSGSFVAATEIDELKGHTIFSWAGSKGSEELTSVGHAMLNGESGMQRCKIDDEQCFVVYGPLSNGWSAIISCQYRDVLEKAFQTQFFLLIIGAIGLLLLFAICYLAVQKMTRPLVEFSNAAISIASGDFSTALPRIMYDDEIGKLRNSFDFMQHSLTDYIKELKTTMSAKERFESELHIARNIQLRMVPTDFPDPDIVDLYACLKPAKEVGGDLYDFFIKDKKLYFAIGDVSGKGVPASLFMAITRSAFRYIAGRQMPIDQILHDINSSLSEGNDTGFFVTMFIGCLDLETGHLSYCNGGHNSIVVKNPDGSAYFLNQIPNIVIGVFPDFDYKPQEIDLAKGSRLILYTDGVTEAEREDKSQYGEDALLQWAEGQPASSSARQMTDSLVDEVKSFADGNEQNDDITVMVIGINS